MLSKDLTPWNNLVAYKMLLAGKPLLEGFVDFVAQFFDADVVAVDFFDEALAADTKFLCGQDLIGRGVTPGRFLPGRALA